MMDSWRSASARSDRGLGGSGLAAIDATMSALHNCMVAHPLPLMPVSAGVDVDFTRLTARIEAPIRLASEAKRPYRSRPTLGVPPCQVVSVERRRPFTLALSGEGIWAQKARTPD